MKNAIIEKFKYDILGNFQTLHCEQVLLSDKSSNLIIVAITVEVRVADAVVVSTVLDEDDAVVGSTVLLPQNLVMTVLNIC